MTLFEECLRSVRGLTQSYRRFLSRGLGSSVACCSHATEHSEQSASAATFLSKKKFFSVSACKPFDASCRNGIYERRRSFNSSSLEILEDRCNDPSPPAEGSDILAPSSGTAHSSMEAISDTENEIIPLQDAAPSESDVDNTVSEELSEDDLLQRSTNADNEFYDLIEAEDNPDELLSILIDLERGLLPNDPRVCHTCLRLAILCNDTNQNPEKVIDYARKAFHNFDSSKYPLESVTALFLVGMGYYKIGDSKEAKIALEKCAFQMERLELPPSKKEELNVLQCNCQLMLGQAKISLGWNLEGLSDIRKSLVGIETALLPEDARLAYCYQETAIAFLQANEPQEALVSCRKAVVVFTRSFGSCSSQVANMKSLMSQIHHELGDSETALCESQQSVDILMTLGKSNEAMRNVLESITVYFSLGKFDKAVIKLKEIVQNTKQEDSLHVEALILLAKAFIQLEDRTAAAEHIERALHSLEQKDLNFDSAKTMIRLATCFQQMPNYAQALALSQNALSFFENWAGKEAVAYAADARGYRGSLYLAIGKYEEALLDLGKALELKKTVHGSDSVELLDVCNHLGVAYVHAGKVDEARAVLQDAKGILDRINTATDSMSIYINYNLALTCILSGRTTEARESKKHAICMIKKAGKEAVVSADEAETKLENLIKCTEGSTETSVSNEQILQQMLPTRRQIYSLPDTNLLATC